MTSEIPSVIITLVGSVSDSIREDFIGALALTQPEPRDKNFYQKKHIIKTNEINLQFVSTLTNPSKESRKLHYPQTRVFVLLFDPSDPEAHKKIKDFHSEIHEPIKTQVGFAVVRVGFQLKASEIKTDFQDCRICSLDDPNSIQALLDQIAIAGLEKQVSKKPERLILAKQCQKYFEDKNFIEGAIAFAQIPSNQLPTDLLLHILFFAGLGRRSEAFLRNTVQLIVSNVRNVLRPRVWSKIHNRLTIFTANAGHSDTKLNNSTAASKISPQFN
ncbi:MAG: hypothetical protein SFW07_01070 [Gammaproteobacteria bacterium]|nr:hypothetical protein [Gammaproteobacteria bacterium]